MARVIAIAGASGSGKSTLAQGLVSAIGSEQALLLPLDAYYYDLAHLQPADREQVNFDRPDSLNLALFREQLIALKSGCAVRRPAYDFATHCRLKEPIDVSPKDWIVVEGIHVASDRILRSLYDALVFVEAESSLRWRRRLARDQTERGRSAASVARFWEQAEATFDAFGAAARKHADCVVRGEAPAVESVSTICRHVTGLEDVALP
ncbi:MAG: AAA family ATPase [Luminiphilus sp.]|nr:AAA family ATPase [Luminiphilus sp.]